MFIKTLIFALCLAVVASQTLNPSRATLQANDVKTIKYALTLENLEAAFYNQMQVKFTPALFAAANLPRVTAGTWSMFELIRAHENAHVKYLNDLLRDLGTSLAVCQYDFSSITTVQLYIQTAALFETVGVSAYDGAIDTVFNSSLVTAFATVATIEARHASYLAGLNNSMPITQSPFDEAREPPTVGTLIAPFLTCPYNIPDAYPSVLKVIPVVGPIPSDPTSTALSQNDINALNYALFLEHLEAAFYVAAQQQFTAAQFTTAGYDASVYTYLNLIRDHEVAHVNALVSTITGLGGTPVPACQYNFGLTTVASYLATAAQLENTGVSAYDGAIASIYNSDLKQTAATIATIEARHASYLNNVTEGRMPIPAATVAFDTAVSPSNIVTAVKGLNVITSCPNNYQNTLPLPVVLTLNAYATNASTATTSGGVTGVTSTTSSASFVQVSAVAILAIFALLF